MAFCREICVLQNNFLFLTFSICLSCKKNVNVVKFEYLGKKHKTKQQIKSKNFISKKNPQKSFYTLSSVNCKEIIYFVLTVKLREED